MQGNIPKCDKPIFFQSGSFLRNDPVKNEIMQRLT